MNFNPNEPCTIGCEWFPEIKGVTILDSDTSAVGVHVRAETADEVARVWMFFREHFGGYSCINLEVFDITAGLPSLPASAVATYYPGTDRLVAPTPMDPWSWGDFSGWDHTTGNLYPKWIALDSPSLTPRVWSNNPYVIIDNDAMVFNVFGHGYDFAVAFDGVTGTQAGRWVTNVTTYAVAAQYLDLGASGAFQIAPYLLYEGRRIVAPAQMIDVAQGPTVVSYSWKFNPVNNAPWTGADIDLFDATYFGSGQMGMGWVVQPTGSSNNLATILQAQLHVESGATDPRLAIGSTILPPSSDLGWKAVRLRSPADWSVQSTVTLVPGRDYLFQIRRANGNGLTGLAPSYIQSSEGILPGPPNHSSYSPTLDAQTLRPVALGEESSITYPFILDNDDLTISLDSQPYMTISSLGGQVDAFPTLNRYYDDSVVHATRSIQQEFTPTTTDEYGWVFVLVAQIGNVVDDDLTITIRDRATDTMQGQPFVITSDDVPEPRNFWRRVGVRSPGVAATLTSGVQYYFDITSGATPSQGWLVQVLNDGNEGVGLGAISPPIGTWQIAYGEAVDLLTTGDPLVDKIGWAACITISTTPDPIEGFSAIAAGPTCNVDHITLTWTPTEAVPCGGHLAYEIQRLDFGEEQWRTIAYITDELVSTFDDYESLRNNPTEYRMRLVRGDRSPSDWTAVETATATMLLPGLTFTSNAAPEMTVFYEDLPSSQSRDFNFPRNYETFQPQGSDYQVVYSEIPNRGTTWTRKVRLRSGRTPCLPLCDNQTAIGMPMFWPLRDISRAGLPYVCIHDENGNRWFAFVDTPSGQWKQHGVEKQGGWSMYTMDIKVVEVGNVTSPADAVAEVGS